ncbi:hypothetical protein [Alteromonas gracilis]|uniref:hypothetical protein n=1 Tax=Alteromonas gracilis TaxID=1479524 RepID=UPI00321C22A3
MHENTFSFSLDSKRWLGIFFGTQINDNEFNTTGYTDTSSGPENNRVSELSVPLGQVSGATDVIHKKESVSTSVSMHDQDLWQLLNSGPAHDISYLNKAISLIVNADAATLKKIVDDWDIRDNNLLSHIIVHAAAVRLAELDPAHAIGYLMEEKDNNKNGYFLAVSALESWAARDADAAIDWYLAHDKDSGIDVDNTFLVSRIFASLSQNGVGNALNLLERFTSEDDRTKGILQITKSLESPDDFQQMLNVVNTANNESIDHAFFASWANKDLTAALDWYSFAGEGDMKRNARNAIFNNYIFSKPEQAANWYVNGASAESYENAVTKVVQRWAGRDTESALRWVREQSGIDTDEAVFMTLQYGAFSEPDFVAQQLAAITNQEQKEKLALQVYRTYASDADNGESKAQKFLESITYRDALEKRLSDDKKPMDDYCY